MLLCVYFIYILDRFLHQNSLIHNYDGHDKKSTHENINVILKFEYFYHLLHENIDIIKIQIIINNLNFQFVLIILYEKDGLKYTETLL